MQRPRVGEQLGHWILEEELGKGSMAFVYLAHHHYIPARKAAIKVLTRTTDDVSRERFQREANAINALDHVNVVTLIDFAFDERFQTPYMVQEYLQGYDVRHLLGQQPALPKQMIWIIAQQICAGLRAVHQAGFVHRDLKPSNLFLLPEQPPFPLLKILDFGIAKIVNTSVGEGGEIDNLTGKLVVGTPTYLAPEQADLQQEVTPLADIYALGVILYELFTGQVPLRGSGFLAHSMELLREARPYARTFRPELADTALEALLFSMIQRDPHKRPASIDEVLDALGPAIAAFADPRDPDAPGRMELLETQQTPGAAPPSTPPTSRGWELSDVDTMGDEPQTAEESNTLDALPQPHTTDDINDTARVTLPKKASPSPTQEAPITERIAAPTAAPSAPTTQPTAPAHDPPSATTASTHPDAPTQVQPEATPTRQMPTWLMAGLVVVVALSLGVLFALVVVPRTRLDPHATCPAAGLPTKAKQRLQQLLTRYQARTRQHLTTGKKKQVWNLSQMTMALRGQLSTQVAQEIGKRILRQRRKNCQCYERLRGSREPSHFVMAWSTLALLTLNAQRFQAPIRQQLRYLLRHQSRAGYWTIHPDATKAPANAAIYPSVLAIWALDEANTKRALLALSPQLLSSLQSAKRQAIKWLYAVKEANKPQWKPYPHNRDNESSSSISAMALFALSHASDRDANATFATLSSRWVRALSKTSPSKIRGKGSQDFHMDLRVKLPRRQLVDPTRYLKLPWQMAAASRIYTSLSLDDKRRLLSWLERAVLQLSRQHKQDWRAVLLLLGFQQLQCRP